MLRAILDPDEPRVSVKPLWAIAAFATSAAFVTSIFAQWLVLLFEQHIRARSAGRVVDTPLTLCRGALIVQLTLAAVVILMLKRYPVLRPRVTASLRLSLLSLIGSLGLVLGLAPIANDLGVRFAEALHQSPENTAWVSQIVRNANSREFVLLALVLTLTPAFVEEYLFRGVLTGALLGAPTWLTLGLQALAFGMFHVDPAQGMATFILGLGFGFVRLRTGTLTAAIVSHATYNGIVLASIRFARHQAPDPSAHQSLSLVLGGALLSAVCIVALRRHGLPSQPAAGGS